MQYTDVPDATLLPTGDKVYFDGGHWTSDASVSIVDTFESGLRIGDDYFSEFTLGRQGAVQFADSFFIAPFYNPNMYASSRDFQPYVDSGVFLDRNVERDSVVITWQNLSYFLGEQSNDYLTFQLEIMDLGDGNSEIIFRYQDLFDPTAHGQFENWWAGFGTPYTSDHGFYEEGVPENFNLENLVGNTGVAAVWQYRIIDGVVQPLIPSEATDEADRISGSFLTEPLIIAGGHGDDTIIGGTGDDELSGDEGNDSLVGGAGQDLIRGGDGDDTLEGGDGEQYYRGTDTLQGDAGHDIIRGGANRDGIDGGEGNDTVDGGANRDRVEGGAGNDIIDGGDHGDNIDGGPGDDTIIEAWSNTPSRYTSSCGGGPAGYSCSEYYDDTINGRDGDDTIAGARGDDVLGGQAGNDMVQGGDGNDSIGGGAGNDVLSGGRGDDLFSGGDGDDFIYGDTGHNRANGGAGADTFLLTPRGHMIVHYFDADDGDRLIVDGDRWDRDDFYLRIDPQPDGGLGDGVGTVTIVYRETESAPEHEFAEIRSVGSLEELRLELPSAEGVAIDPIVWDLA
ncbi:calcium-binding protein [Lutimaribacter marinistellae]|uniref:Calcium-binding protein n=1 Tax=Lutimaribacter marinistellae TaxID=1820329 RepID=A0ABV7TIB3_9RHOB